MTKRGFTLIELVVVVAIIMVIAALLFPVFVAIKQDALRTACFQNFRNAVSASSLYTIDYDDHFMLSNQHPEVQNSRSDHTWVQVLLPYMKSFESFKCPADNTVRPKAEELFDEDLVPGDTISRYYQISRRSNIGYNNVYLAPFNKVSNVWIAEPRSSNDIASPSQTLQFVDTVYQVQNGSPSGGGSYLASPPCRFEQTESGVTRDTFGGTPNGEVFAVSKGWEAPAPDAGAYIYGGAWPWHNGRTTVIYTDGHGGSLTIGQLSEGCNVMPAWQGLIEDHTKYRWSLKL